MRYTLLTPLLLISSVLLAQDFLVTTKGDTLKGNISLQLNGKIETAVIKGDKRTSLSATQVRMVFMNGKNYKPVQFNGNIQFMEIMIEGYLSLLAFQPANVMAYDGRLLQKRDGKLMEVPSLGFKKNVSAFLSDCPDLSAKIKEGELGLRELQDIIKSYNDFISSNTGSPTAEVKPTALENSKLALLNALRSEVEKSDLSTKQDALDILSDWADKIRNNKSVMPYMLKALKSALSTREDLLGKLDEMLLKN